MIPIYRIRNVPTKFMLDNNMSQWSPGWNLTSSADPNSGLFLYDNGMPVRADAAHTQHACTRLPCTAALPCVRADQLRLAHHRLLRHLGRLRTSGRSSLGAYER